MSNRTWRIALGAVAALRQNTKIDYAVMALAMTGIAISRT